MIDSAKPPRIAIVGPGRMGRSIAIAFACARYPITLIDLRNRSANAWANIWEGVTGEIEQTATSLLSLGVIDKKQSEDLPGYVHIKPASEASTAVGHAQVVIECVQESLEAKREVFQEIEAWCSADAVLTSTTSSLPALRIAGILRTPCRFLNTHWLNPAYLMPVVELSCHEGTAPEALEYARSILESIGKVPIVCNSKTGYIVPRLQALIMNEAARLVEEGAATPEDIDRASRYGLGLRFSALGVLEFIDYGGCDILKRASEVMAEGIDSARYTPPQIVDDMVRDGRLGLGAGQGFYEYPANQLEDYRRDALARLVKVVRNAGFIN